MSAKRSFDVRPSPRKKAASAPTVRRRSSVASRRKPLKARRREERQKTGMIVLVLALIVMGGSLYLLWRPEIRIATVDASTSEYASSLESIAREKLSGTYSYVFPRDSFFLYPERSIRAAILEAHPGVSSVSISRTGFTSIALRTSERVAAFHWCGSPESPSSDTCYQADAEGFVFASAPVENASTTLPTLRVYATLVSDADSEGYPLRTHVVGADRIPDILRFSRAIKSLGVPVHSIAIRGDEADLFVPEGTRVTYVIGHEEEAAKGVSAALPSLNLMDGSLEYVDLRFDGKVYLKRRGE